MQLQSITLDDIDTLMPIEIACNPHPWSKKTFKSCIGGRYFGDYAVNNKDVIGFYVAEYVAGEATLMEICVTPTEQGKGFGKQLLHTFLSKAKEQGAEKVFLEVRASNFAAQMLYINNGFTEINRRVGYYPSAKGFGYEDAIIMSKILN